MINKNWSEEVTRQVLDAGDIQNMDARTAGLDLYQQKAAMYAVFPDSDGVPYLALGIASEAGEVAGKVKKIIRDKHGFISQEDRDAILAEVGDVLWYAAMLCTRLGAPLSEVADGNIAKLEDRRLRNKIHGEGDNR